MGVLCLAVLCPSQFGRGSQRLAGPGSVPPLGIAGLFTCCSRAAVSCCHGSPGVLLSPAAVAPVGAAWCYHAPRVLQRGRGSSGWDLGSRARAPPAPAVLAGAGSLALLSYSSCTQPPARAKELHMGPGPSACSHSHQLLVARMVAVTPSSEQCHPRPTVHPKE